MADTNTGGSKPQEFQAWYYDPARPPKNDEQSGDDIQAAANDDASVSDASESSGNTTQQQPTQTNLIYNQDDVVVFHDGLTKIDEKTKVAIKLENDADETTLWGKDNSNASTRNVAGVKYPIIKIHVADNAAHDSSRVLSPLSIIFCKIEIANLLPTLYLGVAYDNKEDYRNLNDETVLITVVITPPGTEDPNGNDMSIRKMKFLFKVIDVHKINIIASGRTAYLKNRICVAYRGEFYINDKAKADFFGQLSTHTTCNNTACKGYRRIYIENLRRAQEDGNLTEEEVRQETLAADPEAQVSDYTYTQLLLTEQGKDIIWRTKPDPRRGKIGQYISQWTSFTPRKINNKRRKEEMDDLLNEIPESGDGFVEHDVTFKFWEENVVNIIKENPNNLPKFLDGLDLPKINAWKHIPEGSYITCQNAKIPSTKDAFKKYVKFLLIDGWGGTLTDFFESKTTVKRDLENNIIKIIWTDDVEKEKANDQKDESAAQSTVDEAPVEEANRQTDITAKKEEEEQLGAAAVAQPIVQDNHPVPQDSNIVDDNTYFNDTTRLQPNNEINEQIINTQDATETSTYDINNVNVTIQNGTVVFSEDAQRYLDSLPVVSFPKIDDDSPKNTQ